MGRVRGEREPAGQVSSPRTGLSSWALSNPSPSSLNPKPTPGATGLSAPCIGTCPRIPLSSTQAMPWDGLRGQGTGGTGYSLGEMPPPGQGDQTWREQWNKDGLL